jgi:hypothetical protein
VRLLSEEGEEDVEIESIQMTGEEDEAVNQVMAETEKTTTTDTAESDVMLLHNDADLVSREEMMLEMMGMKEAAAKRALNLGDNANMFYVPRVNEFSNPKTDPDFYSKAFPHLFCYGRGGFNGSHGLSKSEFTKLLLMRGRDRRFGKDHRFIFAVWTEMARKTAGQIAYIADQHAEASNPAAMNSADANECDDSSGDESLVRINDPISELLACPTAEAMVQTLEKNNSTNLKKLLSKVEAFSSNLQGSALHIALERKSLFAMLLSPIVNEQGLLTVFGTFAPCDRFNCELFDAINSAAGTGQNKEKKIDRLSLLREYPVLAARIFDARVKAMFDKILKGKDMPFGKITDYWIRVEFQGVNVQFCT